MQLKFPRNDLRVSYAKAVHDEAEIKRVLAVLDEHRTIMGKEIYQFEERVSKLFGCKFGVMVNSGSSSDLLALEILNFPEGSEIITPLLTFSTTVAPIIQKKLVPVFADVENGSYQINVDQIEKLVTRKTRALMIPLLLGNVPDLERLQYIAKKNNLFFIVDSCDTFAAIFQGKLSSSFGDIITTSFYCSHIITAGGGGGMIMMDNPKWKDKAKVFRGWGRNSSISDETESISVRFKAKIGNIPYDDKFIFGQLGYNFLPLEMSAAFGNAQLDKLKDFKKLRKNNFNRLYKFFLTYSNFFILPKKDIRVQTCWLSFPLTIRSSTPFTRIEITTYLEKNNIQTRPIFTGNVLKQPGFKNIPHRLIPGYGYPITNDIMKKGFVIGCHQGLAEKHLEKIERIFTKFLNKYISF